jgi:hypothetical protein
MNHFGLVQFLYGGIVECLVLAYWLWDLEEEKKIDSRISIS